MMSKTLFLLGDHFRIFLTIAALLIVSCAFCDDMIGDIPVKAKSGTHPVDQEINNRSVELTEYVLSVIDTVLQHHIDPPTRQSLALAFCKKIGQTQMKLGVGREISNADRHQLRRIVADHIALLNTENSDAIVKNLVSAILRERANATLVLRSEHRVNQQIAANRYVGIGIAIGVSKQHSVIMKVIEDGPADLAGAKNNDQILSVDGVKTHELSLREVVELLRGPAGSQVVITLGRGGEKDRTLTITRNVVPFKQIGEFRVIEPGIASVTINSISGSIVRDLRTLSPKIAEHGIKGVVLDIGHSEPNYRSDLMFADAFINGKTIGAIETSSKIEPIVASEDQLWPGVSLAFNLNFQPNDSLAWALESLRNQRDTYIQIAGVSAETIPAEHAWKYSAVDLPGSDCVIVLPVARLLRVASSQNSQSSHKSHQSRLKRSANFIVMEKPNPRQAQMLFINERPRQPREASAHASNRGVSHSATPIGRAVDVLRAKIASSE